MLDLFKRFYKLVLTGLIATTPYVSAIDSQDFYAGCGGGGGCHKSHCDCGCKSKCNCPGAERQNRLQSAIAGFVDGVQGFSYGRRLLNASLQSAESDGIFLEINRFAGEFEKGKCDNAGVVREKFRAYWITLRTWVLDPTDEHKKAVKHDLNELIRAQQFIAINNCSAQENIRNRWLDINDTVEEMVTAALAGNFPGAVIEADDTQRPGVELSEVLAQVIECCKKHRCDTDDDDDDRH